MYTHLFMMYMFNANNYIYSCMWCDVTLKWYMVSRGLCQTMTPCVTDIPDIIMNHCTYSPVDLVVYPTVLSVEVSDDSRAKASISGT